MLNSDTASRVLAAMASGETYEMGELARRLQLPSASVRETIEQLSEAGYVEGQLAGAQYGSRAGYQRFGLTTAGCRALEPLNSATDGSSSVPSRTRDAQRMAGMRASDVLEAMQPGQAYQASVLAPALGLPMHRVVTFLHILIRGAHVVSVNQRNAQGKVGPHYYVAGTQPGADKKKPTGTQILRSHWTHKPTFDAEYARTLNTLRILSEASRGRGR
ncbi:hypothetical protein WT83_32080 [Burkholderia territorii]|uniref:HTH iclR-type domain-containing protein n=1 Tax=Burkholderia territorii TaxID=1503055 RepID=A0A108E2J7_9BURK|nr:MarR family transcriptional regulator [Burkholderia territorii]KWN03534.1 hypothetical protein WT83_32080 [Burkholderia territorii]